MSKTFQKIKSKIKEWLPLRKIILFESAPDFSDNTMPVFEEMIRRGYNKKYKMYWMCEKEPKNTIKYKNVKYIEVNKKPESYIGFLAYSASICICCNQFFGTNKKGQKVFYLMHGSPFKNTSSYYKCPQFVDYMITAGEYMNEKSAIGMAFDKDKCYPLGYPRNDILVHPNVNIKKYFGDYKKFIIWYPTVKQFSSGRSYGIEPIPFFEDKDNIIAINECAKNRDVLIIIKPHFAQIANIDTTDYSNIRFIDDDFYKKNSLIPYNFLGSCDALLSDYSSVFIDYMICNKPIGLIWKDIETFKKNVGLHDFYEEVTDCCSRIYTPDDLFEFISEVSDGKDKYQDEREKMCEIINAPRDGKNASRVVDFIVQESKMRL